MKLYDFVFAPNPRRLRIYLAEKGLEIPRSAVNLPAGEQRAPAFLAKNPHGSLPVLELDDGTLLSESEAIIEYLEELHPEPPMLGRTALELPRGLAVLEAEIGEFVAGERVTVADCTLFAAFEFARVAGLKLEDGYPRLGAWYERFSRRASAKA